MKKNVRRLCGVVMLGAVVPLMLFGQGDRMSADSGRPALWSMRGKWWKNPKVAEELKLTSDQVAKIDDVFLGHSKRLASLKGRLENGVKDFRNLVDQPDFKRDQVLHLVDKLSAARAELGKATIMLQLDIRDQLTPEQRSKIIQVREKTWGRSKGGQEGERHRRPDGM